MTFKNVNKMSDMVAVNKSVMNLQTKSKFDATCILVHLTNTEDRNRCETLREGCLHSGLRCLRIYGDKHLALVFRPWGHCEPLCNHLIDVEVLLII